MGNQDKTYGIYKISQKDHDRRQYIVRQAMSHVLADDTPDFTANVKRVYQEYVNGNIKDTDALHSAVKQALDKDITRIMVDGLNR